MLEVDKVEEPRKLEGRSIEYISNVFKYLCLSQYQDNKIYQLVKSLGLCFSISCIHKLPRENSLLIAKK